MADTRKTPAQPDFLARCLPCRQKNAMSYLAGRTPGVMAFYAPETGCPQAQQTLQGRAPTAWPAAADLAAEDDETVQRLVSWRQQAPYG